MKRPIRVRLYLSACLFLLSINVAVTLTVKAAPGDLDSTFSGDGKLTDGGGYANSVAIQPDGKIVALGSVLARYDVDGSPDTTFGSGTGKVAVQGESLAIQPDGKIVIVCGQCNSGQITVARYNTDGSLDMSFSDDGIAVTPIVDYQTYAFSVAIQSDGKIVAAGSGEYIFASDFGTSDGFLIRYNPDGALDPTFDMDGVVKDGLGFRSITIQADDKIVTAGQNFRLARYNSNGSLDSLFGAGGSVSTELGFDQTAMSVTIQSDGRIVAAGYASVRNNNPNPNDYGFALVRFNQNGSLDTAFDGDGKVVTPMGPGWNFAQDVAIQPDGKTVAVGYVHGPASSDFAIVRYNTDGSLDSGFGGGDGITTVDFDNSIDRANRMVLDDNGRAVVVGDSNAAFAIARFLLGSSPATITVTNTNDSGAGSLRQMIFDATPGSTINFNESIFATPRTITLTSGTLIIDKNLTIQGPGASLLSISGDTVHVSSVFGINYDVTTTLDGITIKDNPWKNGGGISNAGALTVSNCIISGNGRETYGDYGDGGGIYNASSATLNLNSSTVSGNVSSDYDGNSTGGGIYNRGTVTINSSTISDNVSNSGAGICNYGTMTITNSTISGNTIRWSGGGGSIFNWDPFHTGVTLTIVNSTISRNTGGGITSYCDARACPGNESLMNTIVAGNTVDSAPADILGTVEMASHNLIGDAASSGGIQNGINGNIVGVSPLLGPLANNGGATMTQALLMGSPAINAGDNALAIGSTDQRGAGFQRILAGTVDIGGFELWSAAVSVSGRVMAPDGRGLRNAVVTLTDPSGIRRTTLTSSLEYYSFDSVPTAQALEISVQSKRYRFTSRELLISEDLTVVDFVGVE